MCPVCDHWLVDGWDAPFALSEALVCPSRGAIDPFAVAPTADVERGSCDQIVRRIEDILGVAALVHKIGVEQACRGDLGMVDRGNGTRNTNDHFLASHRLGSMLQYQGKSKGMPAADVAAGVIHQVRTEHDKRVARVLRDGELDVRSVRTVPGTPFLVDLSAEEISEIFRRTVLNAKNDRVMFRPAGSGPFPAELHARQIYQLAGKRTVAEAELEDAGIRESPEAVYRVLKPGTESQQSSERPRIAWTSATELLMVPTPSHQLRQREPGHERLGLLHAGEDLRRLVLSARYPREHQVGPAPKPYLQRWIYDLREKGQGQDPESGATGNVDPAVLAAPPASAIPASNPDPREIAREARRYLSSITSLSSFTEGSGSSLKRPRYARGAALALVHQAFEFARDGFPLSGAMRKLADPSPAREVDRYQDAIVKALAVNDAHASALKQRLFRNGLIADLVEEALDDAERDRGM